MLTTHYQFSSRQNRRGACLNPLQSLRKTALISNVTKYPHVINSASKYPYTATKALPPTHSLQLPACHYLVIYNKFQEANFKFEGLKKTILE